MSKDRNAIARYMKREGERKDSPFKKKALSAQNRIHREFMQSFAEPKIFPAMAMVMSTLCSCFFRNKSHRN